MSVRGIAAVLASAAALVACGAAGGTMREVETRVDGRRLAIGVPDGLEAKPAPRGFALAPPDAARRRNLWAMAVELDPDVPPPAPLVETRSVGGDTARYAVTRAEGGSGGEEVTLVAERPCGGRTLRVRLDVQEELGEPDLEPAWAVLASARCGEPAT
jgi:hypothetical protein